VSTTTQLKKVQKEEKEEKEEKEGKVENKWLCSRLANDVSQGLDCFTLPISACPDNYLHM
jgi:hypothetical protein